MKLRYKNVCKTILLLTVATGMVRCNENENIAGSGGEIEIRDSLPTGKYEVAVSDIQVTAGERSLAVTWEAPSNTSRLAYYQVEWQGRYSDTTLYTAPSTETSYQITHLYNDEYSIRITAVATNMQKSDPVAATGFFRPTEDLQAPENVSDLQVTPVATSAAFAWVNPSDEDFDRILVKVRRVDSTNWFLTDTLSAIESSLSVVGLQERSEYEYSVQTLDYIGNISEVLEGTFKTKMEVLLDKLDAAGNPLWSIVDFSSQETGGDDGRAANAIDGKDNTFWHSVWYSGDYSDGVTSGSIPQYIVIDLKQEVIPSVVMLYRRDGASTGPTSVKVESTLEEPLSKNTEWNDLGTHTLNGGTDNGALPCNISVLKTARYIKITVLAAASGSYAIVREVNVKALVDEE